jgi:hypothetical protein
MINEFPLSSRPYLLELSSRLYSGHATVMVGAGFSRNAIKNDHTKGGFPTWFDLGNAFYKKLYGIAPDQNANYLNALKLAEEVEAAFGRSVLDQMLRTLIPDSDHQPADIHNKLLALPWADIFTTNYDTLLERASQTVLNQKYDLVINKSDLVYAEQPRIIKLHGSFPSERPLIITEEDYRTYPKKFAPFVNTVQQSLIENTLCLIGFSGDDPNFLSWVGWILDNLGRENSPKIYLIGIINLSDAQQKLLATKNIVIVDLVEKGNHNHYVAIDRLLNFLASEDKKDIYINWPEEESFYRYDKENNKEELLLTWSKVREQYPNWLILPRKQRDRLWQNTQRYTRSLEGDEYPSDSALDLNLFYELNWRLEKCLCPVLNNLMADYEQIIEKFSPYFIGMQTLPENMAKEQYSLKNKWIELKLALLRFYREEHFLEKWIATDKVLNDIEPQLQPEQRAKLWYERCLEKLSRLRYSELSEILVKWPINNALPYWEAKRATLLAETGQGEKAMNALVNALIHIRTRLQLSPVVNDYTWVSLEAYLMVLFSYVKQSIRSYGSVATYDQDSHFTKRTDHLKIYKCDPISEIDAFTMILGSDPLRSDVHIKHNFDLGKSDRSVSPGKMGIDTLLGYNYIRFIEEIGLPPRLGNLNYGQKPIIGAIRRIAEASTYLAMASLIRSANKEAVSDIFNREFIRNLNLDTISELISTFIDISENLFLELSPENQLKPGLTQVIIPEMLSRLVTRCRAADRENILSFLLRIYNSDQRRHFRGSDKLMARIVDSLNASEKTKKLNQLMEFPILDSDRPIDEFPDPFSFIQLHPSTVEGEYPQLDRALINIAFKKAAEKSQGRHKGLLRLGILNRLGLLNQVERARFAKVLWSQVAQNGFPNNTFYRVFSFLNLPHPAPINPETIFKSYLQNKIMPIHNGEKSLAMTKGEIPLFQDLVDGTSTKLSPLGVKWSDEEITVWLDKLLAWWEQDKRYLLVKGGDFMFGSTSGEFQARFGHLSQILHQVIAEHSFWQKNVIIQKTIRALILDMGNYGIPITSLKIIFIDLFPEIGSKISGQISSTYAAEEHNNIVDAGNCMIDILKDDKVEKTSPGLTQKILDIATGSIMWRDIKRLSVAIDVVNFCILSNHSAVNEDHIRAMLFGLDKLTKESDDSGSDIPIHEQLINRKKSARLANYLYHYFPEIGQEVIGKWKAICSSEEEFSEVRIQWRASKPTNNIQ